MIKKSFSVFLILLLLCPLLEAKSNKKQILIINSYHPGLSWTDNILKGFKEVMKPIENSLEYYIEFMDTKRFSEAEQIERFSRMIREKYRENKFDLIVVSDNDALNFLKKNYKTLFYGTPVVFCGINNFSDETIRNFRDWFTGVAEETDITKTIEIALKLHPNAHEVYLINDVTTTGLAMKKEFLKAFENFKGTVDLKMIENPDMNELIKEVEKIPSNSIVFLLLVNRDRTGNFFAYEESLEMIYPHTKAPIYSVWDFYLGRGIVGGKLTSAYLQGKKAGEIALQILNGKSPLEIPVIKESPNEYMFDYVQLKRFKISLDKIPKESTVINLPESFFVKYKKTIISAALAFLAAIVVIIVLFTNIQKRKKIEEQLRLSEQKYRDLYDNAPDMYHSVDRNGIIIECNETEAKMLGYRKEEIIGRPITDFMTEESKRAQAEFFPNIDKYSFVQVERDFVRKDGSVFTAALNVYVEVDEKGNFIRTKTIGRDVTYRKKIEEELRRSKEALRKLSVYLQNVREEERKEISREIHDELGQSITALKLNISWIKKRVNDLSLIEKFDEALSIVNAMIKQVQNLSNKLRPSLIDHLTLQDAIKWQAKEFEKNSQIKCFVDLQEDGIKIPKEVSLTLFRIVQEALTNIARHANATEAKIELFKSNGSLIMTIRDNGIGIDESKIKSPESFGLMAMRERAFSINAVFDIKRGEKGGTEIILSVPLKKDE